MNSIYLRTPLVSIIIPTYARPTNLCRAINSCINQDYPQIEIIVVDDNGEGSNFQKETFSLLKKYIDNNQIIYIVHKDNRNGSAARNTGFKKSKGKYINYLDDDDVLGHDKISKQVEILEKKIEYGASYSDSVFIKGKRSKFIKNPPETRRVDLILAGQNFLNTSTVLFRRDIILELNGFDERFNRHQDYELYIRFFRNHKMIKSNCLPVYKYQSKNIISNNPQKALDYLQFFLSAFDDEISKFPLKKQIYSYQYGYISSIALINKDYKTFKYCISKIRKNGKISIKQYCYYIYCFIISIYNSLFH